MILPDVNVLVYAHREDSNNHVAYRDWLDATVNGNEPYGMSENVLAGFLRVVTHPRIFDIPTTLKVASEFIDQLLDPGTCVHIRPGPRHWPIFTKLCKDSDAKGNLVADAYLAALAIESGCEWITTDRDFARFKGLRWRHPLH